MTLEVKVKDSLKRGKIVHWRFCWQGLWKFKLFCCDIEGLLSSELEVALYHAFPMTHMAKLASSCHIGNGVKSVSRKELWKICGK